MANVCQLQEATLRVRKCLGPAVAAVGFVALAWTPILAQNAGPGAKGLRAVVHPENPAPTLAADVAALALRVPTGMSAPTDVRRAGRDSGLAGGLQTARLTTAVRDLQRGVVPTGPVQPPPGGDSSPGIISGAGLTQIPFVPPGALPPRR